MDPNNIHVEYVWQSRQRAMTKAEIHAQYVLVAKQREWPLVVNVKDFDSTQTSIIRCFHSPGGVAAVYASHSTDGKTAVEVLEFVLVPDRAAAIERVAKIAGCSAAAVAQALGGE